MKRNGKVGEKEKEGPILRPTVCYGSFFLATDDETAWTRGIVLDDDCVLGPGEPDLGHLWVRRSGELGEPDWVLVWRL